MKKFFAAIVATLMLLIGTALAAEIANDGSIEVDGVFQGSPGVNPNMANRAAEMLAQRQLAEAVGEIHITSESTINQAMEMAGNNVTSSTMSMRDDLSTRVQSVVKGAVKVRSFKDELGNYHAIYRLRAFGGATSLANAVLPDQTRVEDFPMPRFTNIEVESYTGLIIDCSGLGLSTAIAPAIKSVGGDTIYAYQNVRRELATDRGMVSYAENITSGVQRAGEKPLIVKAQFVAGECDAVVSDEDASKILIANKSAQFLNNCMVVFVR